MGNTGKYNLGVQVFFSAFKVVLMFQFFLSTCKARIVIDSKFEECVIWQKKYKEVYNKTLHKRG